LNDVKELYPVPREMTAQEIEGVISEFAAAAQRSLNAGFEVVEIHMAHGCLSSFCLLAACRTLRSQVT